MNNYYYKETTFKSSGNRGYDFNDTEVFFKDDILKMIHRDSKSSSIIWIDYINNEGYVFDTQTKLANKFFIDNNLPKKRVKLLLKNIFVIYFLNL